MTTASTDPSQTYSEQVYTYFEIGYLLATNPYQLPYKLLRLELDGVVVYDTSLGATSQVSFRFYDGTQTVPDPIVTEFVTSHPGANHGDILLFLPKAEYDSPPKVRAVISSVAALDTETSVEPMPYLLPRPTTFDWTQKCYDVVDGVLYQFNYPTDFTPIATSPSLSAFSAETRTELWRVDWASITAPYNFVALPGSGYVLAGDFSAPPYALALVDAHTGLQLATVTPPVKTTDNLSPLCALSVEHVTPGMYLVFGYYGSFLTADSESNSAVISVDINTGAMVIYDTLVYPQRQSAACTGRRDPGTASFFAVNVTFAEWTADTLAHGVSEIVWNGTTVGVYDFVSYTDGTVVEGVAYDPQTGYVVLSCTNAAADSFWVDVYNARTSVLVKRVTAPARLAQIVGVGGDSLNFFARPGHVLLTPYAGTTIRDLDLNSFGLSTWAAGNNSDAYGQVVDQAREVWFYDQDDGAGAHEWVENRTALLAGGEISLQTAIEQLMFLAGYAPEDLVFVGFDDTLSMVGYTIAATSTTRDILAAYASVYDFTYTDAGDTYYFKKIDKSGTVTTDGTVLDANLVQGSGGSIAVSDKADTQTLSQLNFKYVSTDNGWQANNVQAARPRAAFDVTRSIRDTSLDLPMSNPDAKMQELVTQKLHQAITGVRGYSFATVADFAHYQPGDTLTVPVRTQLYKTQITRLALADDLSVAIETVDISEDVETDTSAVSNNPYQTYVASSFATQFIYLDMPLFYYSDDTAGVDAVNYGVMAPIGQAYWTGGTLFTGDTAADVALRYTQPSVAALVGSAIGVFPAPPDLFFPDHSSRLTISLVSGSASQLQSRSESDVLYGANLAVLGQPGRWEVLAFETVTDNGNGSFTLSDFTYRGGRGSEVHSGAHASGDRFVLLDPIWVRKLLDPVADLDDTVFYKAVAAGATGATTPAKTFTIDDTALLPYAPANLSAGLDGGDIDLAWDYRSRTSDLLWLTPDGDSGEASLEFEVEILDGLSVARTLTSLTANSAVYASADVVTDFGAPPSTLTFRVYQISAAVGRGYKGEASIAL